MATLTIDGTGGDDAIVITASGIDSGSYAINGGPAIAFSGVTQLVVHGGAGNDTLTVVNPDGSLFAPASGISYDGGGQPGDALAVVGGSASNASLAAGATPDAGTLTHASGAITQIIDFAGIAPITDTVAAASFTISGTGGNDNIAVTDGGLVNGFQTTQVSSPAFESVRFANKTTVTIDGLGGNDSVAFNNPNPAVGMATLNLTGVGTVTQTGPVKVANLFISAGGDVQLTNSGNQVGTLAAASFGTFSFTDSSPLVIGTVGAMSGITAAGEPVTLTADNLDIQQQINAGTGIVMLQPLSAGRTIGLGSADSASVLGLTDAELDHVTAGVLRIGKSDAGTIAIGLNAAISPAGTNQLELVTGADIEHNINTVGTDITVSKLAMTAGTGIGAGDAFATINTAVSNIEAQTNTGGIKISNTGSVTVGGVTPSLGGLHVITSGDVTFTLRGSLANIELADTDGSATVGAGSSSGNVFLLSGVVGDVTSSVDHPAITAPAGEIGVIANRDIVLGMFGDADVLGSGTVTLQASRNMFIEGLADIVSDDFGHNTGGFVNAVAGNDILLLGDAGIAAKGSAGAGVNFHTGAGGAVELDAAGPAAVFSNSGDVFVNADRVMIAGTSGITALAPGHGVTIQPVSPAWAVNLGSTTDVAASTLELSDAELDRISTPTLRIGKTSDAADITVSSPITSDGHYGTLSLRTGGRIFDGTSVVQTDITVDNLALQAATGITGLLNELNTAVSHLAFDNTVSGDVIVNNARGLTISAVDGLTSSSAIGGFALVDTIGPLTVAIPIAATAAILLNAGDTAAAGDDLTVLAPATLQSATSFVHLEAGDNVTAQAGTIIQAATDESFAVDFVNADPGVGATATLNGTFIAPMVSINGNGDSDTLIGTPLADHLNGSGGADLMIGRTGDDIYEVDNAGDAVVENPNEGTDTVLATTHFALPANAENLTLQGGADLQGFGNSLANTIIGNAGNNLIDGGAGADLVFGGMGNDIYFVDNAGDAVVESDGQGNDTVFSSVSFTLPGNVENLILQGSADLQGFGNGLTNVIYGNAGNNLIDGRGGSDLMVGGAGNDVYFVDDPSDSAFEAANEGNDTVFTTANYGLAANVETLVMQGSADLQGYGNNQANTIYGNAGNNLINGAGGADLMVGGAGNDTYFVDDPSDSVFENPGEGSDVVLSSANFALAADVETLVMQGSADLQGYGNNQANTIFGNAGNNLINGGGGADTMIGGLGNDAYFVDNGLDQVVENPGEGTDTVFSTVHFILPANVETLVLQGSASANGTGNALNNSIFGNSGDNVLDGQAGADVLTGNAGNDTFVFIIGQGNGDTVVDFAGNGAAAGDSLHFIGYGAGATFTPNDPTHWQVNFNGGASHEVITFLNGAAIDPTDVVFM